MFRERWSYPSDATSDGSDRSDGNSDPSPAAARRLGRWCRAGEGAWRQRVLAA